MGLAGLSKSRLKRMSKVLSGYVERQDLPGMAYIVAHNDDVYVKTVGNMLVGESAPLKRDAIFRIASLAKPITAVAAMILMEECKIRLDDSVENWLPELSNRRVLKSLSSQLDDTVPAQRAITLRDLLTFRMGFGSVMAPPDTYPIQTMIRELKIGGDGPPNPSLAPSTEEWLRGLSSLPLMAQPGESWMYHVSSDVLGVLIARVAGQSLGAFLRERICEPLQMNDTAFSVPPAKIDRLPGSYFYSEKTGKLESYDGTDSYWQTEPAFESGGGGLVGTIDDYFAFSRMMLNKGTLGKKRILSRASVELMTTDHLSDDQRAAAAGFLGDYRSWGFGMSVDIVRDEIFHTPGRFGWDGGFGTSAYTDPAENMIGILFTQRMMDSPQPPRVFTDFWTLAYGAME
ncbi:MAG: serine hydrolase domain-containing protein [Candidatus Obscuribacterales bacterium]|jgi:CubicO group peptidase (beta-lactamase class C family)